MDNNIDEILKEKEKELKEYQSLKLRSLEAKLLEQQEHIKFNEERIKELSTINNAKDLELKDYLDKNRKYKLQLEENLHRFSILTEEQSKSQAKIIEKDKENSLYQSEINNLSSAVNFLQQKAQESSSNHEQELKHLTYINIELEKYNEGLKNDLAKTITTYENLENHYKTLLQESKTTNINSVQQENDYKQRIDKIQAEKNVLQETNENISSQIKSLSEKNNAKKRKIKKLKEKNQEFEFKIRQIQDENSSKSLQIRHKFEQEFRNIQTQYELKDMQVQTLIEEKARFQDRLYEIEKQNYEKITQIERNSQVSQQKILEMTLQSQSKEIEFTKFKQESQIQLENTSNALKNTQEKLQEREKNARLFYQKAQELEKENALLIQEVVTYRKNQQIR